MARLRTYPQHDIKGYIFGRLQIIDFVGYLEDSKKRRHATWRCVCKCGSITQLRQNTIKSGRQRSCGCLLEEFRKEKLGKITAKRNSKPKYVASQNTLLNSYKQRARNKNIKFELNKELFLDLTSKNCYYCNSSPANSLRGRSDRKQNGNYIYNGIDRVNNNIGYISSNCVTCCEICNKAKRNMSKKEFITWAKKLAKNLSNLSL